MACSCRKKVVVKFAKMRENAKIPTKAYHTDAGIDIYWGPSVATEGVVIPPEQSVLLETGIKTSVPDGWCLVAHNKSGISSKKNLVLGPCVVDAGYQGEIFVGLHNIGSVDATLVPGDKLTQFLVIEVPDVGIEEVNLGELYLKTSLRGKGGFGSTD